jgi:protoporphyrinogen IX oxidase
MLTPRALLVFIHVFANLVWIGSIAATALSLHGTGAGDLKARAAIALAIYRRLATPAFAVSFGAGVTRLLLDAELYLVHTKYMHGKLLFALVVIALHHVIGARAKRAAGPESKDPGNVAVLSAVLLVSAGAAAFFAILKPF